MRGPRTLFSRGHRRRMCCWYRDDDGDDESGGRDGGAFCLHDGHDEEEALCRSII